MSCPDCTTGEFLSGEPIGTISTLGAYFSPGSGEGDKSKSAIILLTDVFGLPLKNCKIIADYFAKETGYDVWIPDYFGGWPIFPLSKLKSASHQGGKTTFLGQILLYLSVIPRIPAIIYSRPAVADRRAVELVEAVKKERNYEKIGAVGYCFGGSALVRLGATDHFQSVIICHPGPFTLDEARAIKVPASWVCAESDQFFDDTHRLNAEAVFAERKGSDTFVDYEFRDYKGTIHGFAIRPDLTNVQVKEAFEGSLEQSKAWFLKTLAV